MSESEKTLEQLVEQRTARLRAEVERAREEGRLAGLEEAASMLGHSPPCPEHACGYCRNAGKFRALGSQPAAHGLDPLPPYVEAFEVPGAGVAGLIHSGVPLEGAHKLGTNSENVKKALETILKALNIVGLRAPTGDDVMHVARGKNALTVVERAMDDLRREVEALKTSSPNAKAAGWLEPWEAAELRSRAERAEKEKDAAEAIMTQQNHSIRGLSAARDAAMELVDAMAEPTGRDFMQAWDAACLFLGRNDWATVHPALITEADKRTLEMCAVQEAEMQARLRAEADNAAMLLVLRAAGGDAVTPVSGTELLDRLRTLEQESVPKARVLEVLDAVERESATIEGYTADEQDAFDTGWGGAVRCVRESLGLDDGETGR